MLLGVAAALLGVAFIAIPLWHNSRPLVLPISLQPGVVKSPPFRVDQAESYTVELEVDRVMPINRLDCLLGESPYYRDCGAVKPVVDAQWSLLQGGTVVSAGRSSQRQGGGYSNKTIGKILGWVKPKPGRDYTLEIHVLGDMEELRAAHPRIVVQVDPMAIEKDAVLASLVTLAGLAVGLAGLLWLAYVGYWHLRPKRRLPAVLP